MWDELESLFIYMAWLRLKDMWTLSNDNNQANLIARCPFPTRLAKPFCTLNFKDGKLTQLTPPPKTHTMIGCVLDNTGMACWRMEPTPQATCKQGINLKGCLYFIGKGNLNFSLSKWRVTSKIALHVCIEVFVASAHYHVYHLSDVENYHWWFSCLFEDMFVHI